MTENPIQPQPVNILIVAQAGRLQAEALLFAASLARITHSRPVALYIAEPQPGPLWPEDPRLSPESRAVLTGLGARIVPFHSRHFGATYPQGNKIEALSVLPPGAPFVFFDTDTLILDDLGTVPFDFGRPGASLRREDTWPRPRPGGPDHAAIWRSLYDRFGLDFAASLNPARPPGDWQRYLYFNAGCFFGSDPAEFGARFTEIACTIRDDPPPELVDQAIYPWLDQIALPLVVHGLGGGRDALPPGLIDGGVSCHYRSFPLLYAREDDAVVTLLETLCAMPGLRRLLLAHVPLQRMVYGAEGRALRAMFDRSALPADEKTIRKRLKQHGYWLR